MTFAITTKSGRSVNIKAENYKEAQRYADAHFGKGCIVQLVGNSTNAIVNAALAWKEKTAANAAHWEKFKVGQEIYYKDGPFQCLGTIESIKGNKYKVKDRNSNRIVEMTHEDIAYAVNAVAKNGRIEDKVRVTMECFDFSGLRPVTKVMTLAALKQLLAQIKATATYDRIVSDLERDGGVDVAIDPRITLQATWASRA